MTWTKFLSLTTLGFTLAFHDVHAMEKIDIDAVASEASSPRRNPRINLPDVQERGKPIVVTIESNNLFMRNIINETDLGYYYQIFSNVIAMEKYMEGIPRPEDEIISRYQKYLYWCQDGNPYSSYLTFLNEDAAARFLLEREELPESFTIPLTYEELEFLKNEFGSSNKIFIGHVLLEPGQDRLDIGIHTDAELSYVFLPAFWRRGYGAEAVQNIVELAKVLRQQEFKLNENPIKALISTARPDNEGSWKVLKKNNFVFFRELQKKYGVSRRLYALELEGTEDLLFIFGRSYANS